MRVKSHRKPVYVLLKVGNSVFSPVLLVRFLLRLDF